MELSVLDLQFLAWIEAFRQFLISDRFHDFPVLQKRVLYFESIDRDVRGFMTTTVAFEEFI